MEDDSIYDACPIRSQLTDFGERLQHTWVNCNICCRLKQKADNQKSNASNNVKNDGNEEVKPLLLEVTFPREEFIQEVMKKLNITYVRGALMKF